MGFDSNGPVYDIEEILDHKVDANGKTRYYVKWKVILSMWDYSFLKEFRI